MSKSTALFMILIADGYSFRNCIGMIQGEVEQATLHITPEEIALSCLNREGCAMHDIHIDTHELQQFTYSPEDEEGHLVPSTSIGFRTDEMFKALKNIGRKDSVRIYCLEGNTHLNIEPIKGATKGPGRNVAVFVPIVTGESRYQSPPVSNNTANFRLNAKCFSEICALAVSNKCSWLEFVCETAGITLKGVNHDGSVVFINPCGNSVSRVIGREGTTLEEQKPLHFTVPIATIKAISKIHNISPQGAMLKFCYGPGQPLKLISPIGSYGIYTLCLRDPTGTR